MAEINYLDEIGILQLITLIKTMGAEKLEVRKINELPSAPKEKTIYLKEEETESEITTVKAYIYDSTKWLSIGGTNTNIQVAVMPTANEDNKNKILQYIGDTTDNYIHGHFYECVETEPDVYNWTEIVMNAVKDITSEELSNMWND